LLKNPSKPMLSAPKASGWLSVKGSRKLRDSRPGLNKNQAIPIVRAEFMDNRRAHDWSIEDDFF
jgi:hypothetical protein